MTYLDAEITAHEHIELRDLPMPALRQARVRVQAEGVCGSDIAYYRHGRIGEHPARVVIAVDSFKGTISAAEAARALADGWTTVRPTDDVVLCPMADGGEGTLEAFETAMPGATSMPVVVAGPADEPVTSRWLRLPPSPDAPHGTGVVELASTSGIELLAPGALRPLDAHTFGFGEAIAAALAHGVSRLVLAIGSSSSTDGGAGMLTALGASLRDSADAPVAHGGRGLADVASVDLSALPTIPPGGVTVLSDVTAPLLGPLGAATVFAPQKGATPDEVRRLEDGLARLAALVPADASAPGAGAAGGTGFGLLAWGAELSPGAARVAELIGLKNAIASASLVITGEGAFDGQSAQGKAPAHVAAIAATRGTPVALVAGRIAPEADISGYTRAVSLSDLAGGSEAAMRDAATWLREAGCRLALG